MKTICLHFLKINFVTCFARRHYEDIRAEHRTALTAARITMTVNRSGHGDLALARPTNRTRWAARMNESQAGISLKKLF